MTFQKVRRMLAEILGIDEDLIAPGMRINRQNGIDAVSLAKLVIKCERAFRITIYDEDVADLERVADLIGYIDERVAEGRGDYAPPSDEAREAWYYE